MTISEQEILRRRDMRDALTFTIDPADAKDFDDALSFQRMDDGDYQIGVHIADVTYYVRPDDDIDKEAYRKTTSTYLVDRVIPMLPEELCNDLCSLRPNEDKLCMSVIFTIAPDGKIRKHKICRTVICSNFRLCYEQAQDILDHKTDTLPAEIQSEELFAALRDLNMLALIFRQKRIAHGALEIEQDEVRFTLDENHHPTGIYFVKPTPSHHLIEEFMLLANRTIAEQMAKTGKTMVYRVHDKPDPEKLSQLERFERRMGERIQPKTLNLLTIRAMAKAVYSTQNIGHYGLAFDYYTHFTSPIRRYPDMMVHRIVAKYILGERRCDMPFDLEEACQHCSDGEIEATNAERESIKEMQTIWIHDHLGEDFDGYIASVTDFGVFVTLNDTLCDGLIHIRTLNTNVYFEYDERCCCLRATHYREQSKEEIRELTLPIQHKLHDTLTLGDEVRVRVIRADIERSQIEFALVAKISQTTE